MSDDTSTTLEAAEPPVYPKHSPRRHFTTENIEALKRAMEICQEISYCGGAWEGMDIARDARIVERAGCAARELHSVLVGGHVYYDLHILDEPEPASVPEPQSLRA